MPADRMMTVDSLLVPHTMPTRREARLLTALDNIARRPSPVVYGYEMAGVGRATWNACWLAGWIDGYGWLAAALTDSGRAALARYRETHGEAATDAR